MQGGTLYGTHGEISTPPLPLHKQVFATSFAGLGKSPRRERPSPWLPLQEFCPLWKPRSSHRNAGLETGARLAAGRVERERLGPSYLLSNS